MYNKNHNYFSRIDTKKKAYILGFLYGDGYVTSIKNSHTHYIGCDVKDKDVLRFIKKELVYNGPIDLIPHKPNNMYRLRVCSRKLARDLIAIGLKSRKLPTLEETLVPYFICGLFDSDGSIHVSKDLKKRCARRITFSGKTNLMIFVRRFLHNKYGFILPKIKIEKCGTRVLQYVTKHVELFYRLLYKKSPYRLRRKEKIFMDNEIVRSRVRKVSLQE